jgi:hypothetical protein
LVTNMEVLEAVKEVSSSPKRARGLRDGLIDVGEQQYVVGPSSKKLRVEGAALSSATPNGVFEFDDLELRGADDDDDDDENVMISCSSGDEGSCVLNHSSDQLIGCMSGDEYSTEELILAAEEYDDVQAESLIFRGRELHPGGSRESSTVIGKEDDAAARVLRSLEEELGVSPSECDDYTSTSTLSSMASSSGMAQEALVEAALSSWGEEIWNSTTGFNIISGEISVAATVGCSSGSSTTESAAPPGCQGFGDQLCTLSSALETPVDGAAQVDIGFLSEASDDELGIPPSPHYNTDRRYFHEEEEEAGAAAAKEACEENMSALSEVVADLVAHGDHHQATTIDAAATGHELGGADQSQLHHETFSWALQAERTDEEYPEFDDIAPVEDTDWLMPLGSNLDFLLDFSNGYVPAVTT